VTGAFRGVVLGLAIAGSITGCVVRQMMMGPRLTGTCDGACQHYMECKTAGTPVDRTRCNTECPDVFEDRDSLMAYESLSCPDAVDFIDGSNKKVAKPR
jgi:hypothetical protein